jgi:hypothetical protein
MSDASPHASPVAPFFPVGLAKFVTLSLTTFGLYQLLWFFQHWRHRRDVMGERVVPAARSLFAWIFVVPLGLRIAKASVASRAGGRAPAILTAGVWAISALGSALLPDGPLALLGLSPILPATFLQMLANRVNASVAPLPAGQLRDRRRALLR